MKRFFRYSMFIAALIAILGPQGTSAKKIEQLGLTWYTTLAEGLQVAAAKNKPIFLDFWDIHSSAYKKQFEETYKDPRVKKMFTQFVLVTVNIVKEYDTARRFRVSQVPSVLFLDPAGKELGRHRVEQRAGPGFLVDCMEGVLGDLKALKDLKRKIRRNPDDLKLVLGLGEVLEGWLREDEAIPYYKQVAEATAASPELRKQAREGWARALLAYGNRSGVFGNTDMAISSLRTFLQLFPKHKRAAKVRYMLALYLIDKGERQEAAKILKKIQRTSKGKEAERAAKALKALEN